MRNNENVRKKIQLQKLDQRNKYLDNFLCEIFMILLKLNKSELE